MFDFAPDRGWEATYELDGKAWTLPVIGWAVMSLSDQDGVRQEVEPVVLSGTTAEAHTFYRRRHPGAVLMKLTDTTEAS